MHKYIKSNRDKGNTVSYNIANSQMSDVLSDDWYETTLSDNKPSDSLTLPEYPEVVQPPAETSPPVNTEVISRPREVPNVSPPKITKKNTVVPETTKSNDTLFNLNSVMVLLFIAGAAFLLIKTLKKLKI